MTVTVAEHCGGNSGRGNICVWLVVFGALVHVSCINKGKLGLNTCFSSAIGYRKTEKKNQRNFQWIGLCVAVALLLAQNRAFPRPPSAWSLSFEAPFIGHPPPLLHN